MIAWNICKEKLKVESWNNWLVWSFF